MVRPLLSSLRRKKREDTGPRGTRSEAPGTRGVVAGCFSSLLLIFTAHLYCLPVCHPRLIPCIGHDISRYHGCMLPAGIKLCF